MLVVVGSAMLAEAQLPPPPVPAGGQLPGGRAPDDQVEGTIFEYKGTHKPASKTEEEPPALEGKFRLEGTAIFDVSATIKLPSKAEVDKAKAKIAAGKGGDIKLPPPPQQKRLGQYKRISGGKLRLDFDDKESLNGTMILTRDKTTDDVWLGTFTEKQGAKTGRVWQMKVRPIED
jgi:hypothetical protein